MTRRAGTPRGGRRGAAGRAGLEGGVGVAGRVRPHADRAGLAEQMIFNHLRHAFFFNHFNDLRCPSDDWRRVAVLVPC